MSEEEKLPETPLEEPTKEPVIYASPMKRVWAWVGVGYMVILTFLLTYFFAFGTYLKGIGALIVCPALAGVAVTALLLWRQGKGEKTFTNQLVLAIIIALCGGLVVINLWNGIPSLMTNFGVR